MATPMTPDQMLAAYRAEGLTVHEVPGWRDRCRCHTGSHEKNVGWVGNTAARRWGDINGQLAHITAGGLGNRTVLQYIRDVINGDPAVPTKSQTVIGYGGGVWVNSAGRCNHAGKVGSRVRQHMIAADFSLTDDFDNRFTGGTTDGNAFTYGDECIAASHMTDDGPEDVIPDDQYDALVLVHAARARFHGWTGQESVGHGEVSNRRGPGDPNLHMGRFRRDVMARVKAGPLGATTPTPTPVPVTAVWGKPETFVLGATGPDVTRYGERIVIWSDYYGLKNPYRVGPGPTLGPADIKGASAVQVAMGYGSKPADLAKGGNSDGYPGPQTFKDFAADPPAATVPPVPSTSKTLRIMFLPMAGYNSTDKPGVTDWEKNTRGLAALVNKHKPHLFGTTELSNRSVNRMLPLLDALVPDYVREGGSDGRYTYRHKDSEHIASGVVEAAADTLLDGDDRQAGWSAQSFDKVPTAIIVGHAENQDGIDPESGKDADHLRPAQTLSMASRGMIETRNSGVPNGNVIYLIDTNSSSWAKDAMVAKGWVPIGPGYFTRWDDSAEKTFDWGFIRATGSATFERINHEFSDHTALLIEWTFPV